MKKKIFLSSAVLAALCFSAPAQTMYDAITFGTDNYYGSARTMGMGNAVTAIGGDLGSVSLNPAASAVAGYSQVTITPGLAIAKTASSWAPAYNSYDAQQEFSGPVAGSKTRFTIPNTGFSLRFETGELTGLKSWTFAFVSNMTNNWCEESYSNGFNAIGDMPRFTSLAGALATGAMFNSDGAGHMLNPDIIFGSDKYNTLNAYGNYDRWQYIAAYDGGLINWNDDAGGSYYGASEYKEGPVALTDANGNPVTDEAGNPLYTYYYGVPGRLAQTSHRLTVGSKNDITTNFAFNFNDRFYVGVNFTFPIANYRYSEIFSESADETWPAAAMITPESGSGVNWAADPSQYFKSATYRYDYDADISGINASLGIIWLPTDGLRIGASIKTPTAYTVNEHLRMRFDTEYELNSYYAETPEGEFSYNYRSPWSLGTGLAYTFGTLGMLSADWQMTDFSVMKYSVTGEDGFTFDDPYEVVNTLNGLFCGVSHTLRLGAEIRPLPFLSLRAGYTLTTNPERYYYDNEGYFVDAAYYENNYNFYQAGKAYLQDKHYVDAPVTTLSCGLGFVSTGSFFADLAFRRTRSASFYSPYNTYLEATDADGNPVYDSDGNPYMVISPCVRTVRSLFDAVLTLGWRF